MYRYFEDPKRIHFRRKLSYVRSPEHKPKEKLTDFTYWRLSKGFSRDQSKKQKRYGRGKFRSYIKNLSNREHRQLEKRKIKHEQWDDLFSVKPKDIYDPWRWD